MRMFSEPLEAHPDMLNMVMSQMQSDGPVRGLVMNDQRLVMTPRQAEMCQ